MRKENTCMYCLQCFSSDNVLNKHKNDCIVINGEQAIKIPQKGDNIIKFQNYNRQLKAPFVIYADFEAVTEKVQSCKPNDNSYTEAYQKHTDCGLPLGIKMIILTIL